MKYTVTFANPTDWSVEVEAESPAEAFDRAGALERFEAFASFNGPDFYGLPRNTGQVTLVKKEWEVPASYPFIAGDSLVPLAAGETLRWQLV